jgi:tRNA threonylcarbamoyl adenosine modification protein (Sua5/YciO/YrdC/YwlC family)
MSTILHTNPINPQKRHIRRVVEALTEGKLVSYPTDTTYGIGCDLLNKRAIEKIYALKKRDRRKPVSILCSDLKELSQYAVLSNSAYRILRRLLPGPYTFILPATPLVPKVMLTPQKMVGARIPDSRIVRDMVEGLGRPLISTSATMEDGTVLNDPEDIEKRFRGKIDIVIAEECPGQPSSIVDLTGDEPVLIRQGLGDLSWLED